MRIFHRIATQPLGVMAGAVLTGVVVMLAASLTVIGGQALATHDETGNVHACVSTFTGQTRVIPPGQAPNCTDNEILVEWPGLSFADDLAALTERVDALQAENDAQADRISDLEDQADDHESRISALQTENGQQADRISDLEDQTDDQEAHIDDLQEALDELDFDLPSCLTTEGDDVVFDGCNVHIRNGEGGTETTNGTGNLIIGYNENSRGYNRDGSHNLVIGADHLYSSYGGLVAGFRNLLHGPYASISGGSLNFVSSGGEYASISGGYENLVHGAYSSISGGASNVVGSTGEYASISGGFSNNAVGAYASVSGGFDNRAFGDYSSLGGGEKNTARGKASSVSGGLRNSADGNYSSVSGGQTNGAIGFLSSVTGGSGNEAIGSDSHVIGGQANKANGQSSTVLGGLRNEANGLASIAP